MSLTNYGYALSDITSHPLWEDLSLLRKGGEEMGDVLLPMSSENTPFCAAFSCIICINRTHKSLIHFEVLKVSSFVLVSKPFLFAIIVPLNELSFFH